ncbi:DUF5677 domain-containing protein [Lysinibacillus xylanilyticus]|uniref:DUF5677 domain-containing protein n=1 Tax=Lysinibacillus xylanilyticus TaxID=582475 RepID=A0ABV3VQ96_9BACI
MSIMKLEEMSKLILFGNDLVSDFTTSDRWEVDNVTKFVVISLYRDSIESLDALYILTDHGSQNAAGVSYRHMYEIVLSLLYILNDEKKMKQRAESYYVGMQQFKIIELKKMLKNNNLSKDEKFNLNHQLAIIENSLKQEIIKDTLKEWNKAKRKNNSYEPKWHSLFGGPNTINKLIKDLKENSDILKVLFEVDGFKNFFESAYSFFSRTAHSYNSLDNFIPLNSDGSLVTLRPLRIPTKDVLEGPFRISESIGIIMIASALFILRIFPEYKGKYLTFANEFNNITV